MEITINGEALDLPSDFSIEIEDSNPIYNERGSQSIPATVPTTRRNNRILSFPARIDAGIDPNNPERIAQIQDGAYIRRGAMNITEAGKKEGITFNVGFDNSTAYAKWQKKKLSELSNLPTYTPDLSQQGYPIDLLLDELYRIYQKPDPQKDDFAVFPLAVNNESTGSDKDKKIYWEVLNLVGSRGLEQPTKVKRLINGEITEVSVPEGYMVSPFLRVWRILELIFADMGLTLVTNPFAQSLELSRLVVLNNAADSCCRASIRYADLMPDSTVEEFLNALWVRFGLVYNIDYNTATARLVLIKDIIHQTGGYVIDYHIAGTPKITYEERQYIKLSAQSSIEGAAPSHERFEDFAKGLDVSQVRLGNHVSQWQNTGTPEEPKWDGDVRDDWGDDYRDPDDPDYPDPPDPWGDDYPEPDDDRDDGRDDYGDDRDYYALRSTPRAAVPAAQSGNTSVTTGSSFLAREFVTGMWYRLDSENGKIRLQSSSFFNWDPQPEGLNPLELSSDDEWVPVIRVSNVGTGTGHSYNDMCPTYLFGARHYHSYIKGSDETDEDGDTTPLAFMFAYTKIKKSFGRLTPEDDSGQKIILDDGTTPTISLLFQFKDGLFNKFWADYDEILRHGNRSVEIPAVFNKLDLFRLDVLSPVKVGNIRCLIDTATYSLPSGRNVPVDLKLRTIQTHGKYDIKKEQNVPDFAAAARHLEWRLKSETYGETLNTPETRTAAVQKYIKDTGYQSHGTEGDYYYIGVGGMIFKSITRTVPTWQTDSKVPKPGTAGQRNYRKYKALITYSVFEIHDMSFQDGPQDWGLDEVPLGEVTVTVEYDVILVARWVND